MSTSSPEHGDQQRNTPNDGAHVARLFALADQVDFVEQLDHAGRLIDRRRRELLAERRQPVRKARDLGPTADRREEEEDTTRSVRRKGGTPG